MAFIRELKRQIKVTLAEEIARECPEVRDHSKERIQEWGRGGMGVEGQEGLHGRQDG